MLRHLLASAVLLLAACSSTDTPQICRLGDLAVQMPGPSKLLEPAAGIESYVYRGGSLEIVFTSFVFGEKDSLGAVLDRQRKALMPRVEDSQELPKPTASPLPANVRHTALALEFRHDGKQRQASWLILRKGDRGWLLSAVFEPSPSNRAAVKKVFALRWQS